MSARTLLLLAALTASTLLTACGPGHCIDADGIEPGVGVAEGGLDVCLGEELDTVVARLGQPDATVDLGTAGGRHAWSTPDLVVWTRIADEVAVVDAIQLQAGVAVATPGGVAVGASEADAVAEFGEGSVEPFAGAKLHPGDGIGFTVADDAITRIHLFVAQ
jgi:hypothetical protein